MAVLIHFALVFGAVGKAARAADAPANAGHAFDKVLRKQVLAFFQQRDPALLNTVAYGRLQVKVQLLLLLLRLFLIIYSGTE